jgi:hypothetical protein
MIERLLKRNPAALKDGWIVEDEGGGDLKYDNGICAVALVEAFEVVGHKRYLEGAERACEWAMSRPYGTNWNYNAFSVWALARVARATGKRRFLDAAVEELKVGVLPGQMESGRWFDPHNARLVYHAIIVRAMLEVYQALPEKHALLPTLKRKLILALDEAAGRIRKDGASSNSTTTEMFGRALILLGPKKSWEEALYINVNAGIRVMKDRRAPNVGLYLVHYLEAVE